MRRECRRAEAAGHTPVIRVKSEPLTYRKVGAQSYWKDRACLANSEFENLLYSTTRDQSQEQGQNDRPYHRNNDAHDEPVFPNPAEA